ncbi:hypothetical protein ANCCAN_19780 [Ancylostoma caninum]|uniref:Uncharacterized protein n=1 Tax=Ancylostoma caninum TaxID=29170 RepID=A0A368FSA8_ANCCA|nr:hypothetical protein ANCCAN_19780 [Ancylostoma caninum]
MSPAQVVCLLPRSLEDPNDEQVLQGCPENKNTAFSDWGHRAFLYAVIVKTAGYGFKLHKERTSIGCSYERKSKKAYCFTL